MTEKKETDSKNEIWENVGVLTFTALIFAGPAIFSWQIYKYLRVGSWPSLSVVDALKWCNVQWATTPVDWVGLHRSLEWMPLSLFIPLVIGLFFLVAREL